MEPMEADLYNNNVTNSNSVRKRKATDGQQSDVLVEKGAKFDRPCVWANGSCLKLDVYTQTDSSFVSDNYSKSLVRDESFVSEMVQANSKRLENIEKFLEALDCKIESFLSGESTRETPRKKGHVQDSFRKTEMKVREPPIPEGDSDMSVLTDRSSSLTTAVGNPRDTFMSSPADSTKSPSMCLSPGVSSNHASSPVTTHSFVAWNQGYHQGFDTMAKQIPQEGRTPIVRQGAESVARPVIMATKPVPVSRETEADHSLGDEEGLVPVIVSLGDNPPSHRDKKCVSTEVPLKDIINGAPCAMEGLENISYSRGCWLGDRSNPQSRVWYCGNPKILGRAEASGSNPAKLSLNLLEAFFVRDEMAASNINGARGRELLDPIKIKGIQAHVNYKFPISAEKEELRWQFLKPRIDSKCRAQRRLQREEQLKRMNMPRVVTAERTARSRVPRLDPKEKDQLLYGYNRNIPNLGLGTPRAQVAALDDQGTGVDVGNSQLSGENGFSQLQANEAIVEISGIPVTVNELNR
nr:uncharacterized protein LOC131773658 isoform X3 [Pocillopora verrucosa]